MQDAQCFDLSFLVTSGNSHFLLENYLQGKKARNLYSTLFIFNKFTNYPTSLNLCNRETGAYQSTPPEAGKVRVPATCQALLPEPFVLHTPLLLDLGSTLSSAYAKNTMDMFVLIYCISTKNKILLPDEKARGQ